MFKLRKEVVEVPEFHCYEKGVYYCYLEYDGKKCYPNGSITVPKGAKVKANFCIDTKGNKVALQVWDYKNWKQLAWKEKTGGFWCDVAEFTAEEDADVVYVLYKYEGGWVQVDTYGTFYLRTAYIPPKPKIVEAYLKCNGERIDVGEEVTIEMPVKCYAHVTVKNESEGSGKCAIQVWNRKTNKELRWREFNMTSNQPPTEYTPKAFTVEDDADIEIHTYYYDEEEGEWKHYDSIGCL